MQCFLGFEHHLVVRDGLAVPPRLCQLVTLLFLGIGDGLLHCHPAWVARGQPGGKYCKPLLAQSEFAGAILGLVGCFDGFHQRLRLGIRR